MNRGIVALLMAAAYLGPAVADFAVMPQQAEANMILAPASSPPPAYSGPGDQATFTSFYGWQAYTAAIAAAGTQKLVHLIRASDSHACDVLVATSGSPGNTASCGTGGDNGQSASSFCNATTCSGYFYDQVTTNDLSDNGSSVFPNVVFNCINSLPCFEGTTTSQFMRKASNYTPSQAVVSIYGVAQRVSGTNALTIFLENGANNGLLTRSGVANNWQLSGGSSGTINATANDASFHLGIGLINGASSSLTIDGGTAATGTVTGNTTAGRTATFAGSTSLGNVLDVEEIGFKDSATVWTNTELTNLHANAVTRLGTP